MIMMIMMIMIRSNAPSIERRNIVGLPILKDYIFLLGDRPKRKATKNFRYILVCFSLAVVPNVMSLLLL